jgi:hypothetical protein
MSTSSAFAITNNWETLVFILPVSILTIWLLVNPASKANWLCERFCPFLISLIRKPILIINSSSLAYCTFQNWAESKNNMEQICLIQNYRLILHPINSQMKQINQTKSLIHLCSILIILTLGVTNTFAQPYETNPDFNRTRNWHFGDGVGLKFDPDTIYEVQTSIHTDEAAAVHTDQDGNLLLYSNGEKIWNANHEVIHNGNFSLGHNSSGMGSVFVFHEDNPDHIYLFNTFWNISTTKEFSVNLIVREADTFRIVFKDSVLMYSVCEPIAVVKADNGKDVWITVHEFGTNNLYSYFLTSDGIISCPIVSKSKINPTGSPNAAAFDIVFSPNGQFMIRTVTNLPPPIINTVVEIYEFNNSNGSFDFLFSLDSFNRPFTGLGFSKDNSKIFVVERDSGLNVFDFNPDDSITTVATRKKVNIEGSKFQIQNTPYGNSLIWTVNNLNYLAMVNIYSIGVIDSIKLFIGLAKFDLPNFNQSYFHTPSIDFAYDLNCIDNAVKLYGRDTFQANNHDWLITKTGKTPLTNNTKTPLLELEDTGTYTIRYIATNGSRNDTITKEIIILPNIDKHFLGNDTGWCETIDTSIIIKAPLGMHCYEWSTGETTPQITIDTTGTYIAKITTPNFCVLYDTIVIFVDSLPESPIIYQNHDTLKTDAIAKGYQWYKNNQPIGTNNSFLKITDTGIYHISLTSQAGCVVQSDTIQVFRVVVKTIEKMNFKVYPNPFNHEFIVEHNEAENLEIVIFNLLGQKVFETNMTDKIIKINTHEWENGIYFMEVIPKNSIKQTIKLIKQTE